MLQDIWNSILPFISGAGLHCLECFFVIETFNTFQNGIRDDRHGAVSRHTFCFTIVQSPDWQFVLLAIDGKHGVNNARYSFRLGKSHQRLQCAVCIPQRKGGIVFLGWRSVNHIVHATEFAVHITISRWSNHGVIMSGIENTLVSFALTFYNNLLQLFVPTVCTGFHYLVEIPMVQFRFQIHGCIFATYWR